MGPNTNFDAAIAPTPSGKENGLTTPLPGIGNPALNTPPTQNEHVGTAWRGGGYTEAVDGVRPAVVQNNFGGADLDFASMDQSSGGGGYPTGGPETSFGDPMWKSA